MDKNCFACVPVGRRCAVLKKSIDCGPAYPFNKNIAAYQVARWKADWRLSHLSAEMQWYIADKYYKGKRPWLKADRKAVGE